MGVVVPGEKNEDIRNLYWSQIVV